MGEQRRRPTAADLAAARGRGVPDILAPGLRVVFCGINPSLYSAAVGHHFARPGNRFWPTIHGAGFTDRLLSAYEDGHLPGFGLGCTNLVDRATARADELDAAELRAGAGRLTEMAERLRPDWLAVLGVSAYRSAFGRPQATVGPQPERLGGTAVWVLPNPSGLNAHYQLPGLIAEYRRLRDAGPPNAPIDSRR
ncbi:MAG TPA: G/U mismatch-specific DNA glycosylase [Candidatus Dormibacteraeota bacterium]|nr:G/U mismatch-specific DNA glycosylase [Candidatus Dormibacteraeota bacterium]